MISKFASLLLASVALVVSTSQLENRQSQTVERVPEVITGSNGVAGAYLYTRGDDVFVNVSCAFTVPSFSGRNGSFTVSLGIFGDDSCDMVNWGVVEMVMKAGNITGNAWWLSDLHTYQAFDNSIIIMPGHYVQVTVSFNADANVVIDNRTADKKVLHGLYLNKTRPCGRMARLALTIPEEVGSLFPLADPSDLVFTNITAVGSSGTNYDPSDAITWVRMNQTSPDTFMETWNDKIMVHLETNT